MSKYVKLEIDAGPFKDMLPEGAKFYMRHELPEIEFKKDGIKYRITDFQLLHPLGVDAFLLCLDTMLSVPGARECKNCLCYSDDGWCEAFVCQKLPNTKGCFGFIPKEPKEG